MTTGFGKDHVCLDSSILCCTDPALRVSTTSYVALTLAATLMDSQLLLDGILFVLLDLCHIVDLFVLRRSPVSGRQTL